MLVHRDEDDPEPYFFPWRLRTLHRCYIGLDSRVYVRLRLVFQEASVSLSRCDRDIPLAAELSRLDVERRAENNELRLSLCTTAEIKTREIETEKYVLLLATRGQ